MARRAEPAAVHDAVCRAVLGAALCGRACGPGQLRAGLPGAAFSLVDRLQGRAADRSRCRYPVSRIRAWRTPYSL